MRTTMFAGFLILSSALLAPLVARAESSEGLAKKGLGWPEGVPRPSVDCSCRPPGGGKLPVGAEICIRKDGVETLMRCELALNNTIWKPVKRGCDPVS
ncbi:MAG: hypothetical protein AAFW46_05130 [Pseudomonadota bacterium]